MLTHARLAASALLSSIADCLGCGSRLSGRFQPQEEFQALIFDRFDHAISMAFLKSHFDGTLLVTLKGGDEFSLVTLDDKADDWPVASGTRYGGAPVKFVIDDVLFVEPRSVDPRMTWPQPARTFDDPRPPRRKRTKAPQPAPEAASTIAA